MGKKGKKGGGKKSGKGKKGKSKEPEITFQEAILAYRIGLVEKQIEDWKFEENNLEEQKTRLEERNERLGDEREQYCKLLLKQSREFEKKNLLSDKVGKEHVMDALEEKWEACKQEDKNLEDMQTDILNLERTIARSRKDVIRWLEYKDIGSKERAKQIELLEKELKDMKQSYDEMSDHLSRNLEVSREKIVDLTERTLNTQKHSASEKAMATLDKKDRQEVLDNDWMKVEVQRYEEQCQIILGEVETIERQNLELMGQLFECNVEDLKVTRNLFLTQFDDVEDLADGGILEVDLKQVSLLEREKERLRLEAKGLTAPAITAAGEPAAGAAAAYTEQSHDEFDEMYDDRSLTPDSEAVDPFDNYYNFHDEDMEEYLQLGPLELKLLSLAGEQKPIYVQGGNTAEEIRAQEYNPEHWPVTQPMLKTAVTPRPVERQPIIL